MEKIDSYQQIIWITTNGNQIYSEAVGWGCEFGNLGAEQIQDNPQIQLGLVRRHPYRSYYTYVSVAHALRFGWKLLCQSVKDEVEGCWNWTLVRNVNKDGDVIG